MGSEYNMKMLWETGEITYEPLDFLARDIPVELIQFDMDNNLLDKLGWKRFKQYKQWKNLVERLIKQAKLCSFCFNPKYNWWSPLQF